MKFDIKRLLPDFLCVVLFAVIAFAYFYPATFDGRTLSGHDHSANDGISVEIKKYRESHDGETPRWVTSVFGGMPTYQIAPSYDSTKVMTTAEKAYHLWMPDYVWYIFASMLGFYILLRAFDFKQWMAALGAIIWAFSSYFFIIIAAGHIWKVMTLAYIPPTIAGVVKALSPTLRAKKEASEEASKSGTWKPYLIGASLAAFFGALQIQANHVQMTYYFLFPIAFMVIAYLVSAIKNGCLPEFGKGIAALAVGAVIAVSLNLSNLYNTYEYAKDTMRGKSELVKQGKVEDQTDSGLERSYITAWSYGIGETWTLLVPNINGGASVPLSANETAMKEADPQFANAGIYNAFGQYWGEQPGTSGPVYVGALVFMLFVMSLFLIPNKNPMKWALLAATILSIMLAWGHNFMGLTNFFIDHFPMYAKFRTVASILVIAEFTIPLMAMWALKIFVEECCKDNGKSERALYIATGFTIIICAAFALTPGTFFGDCLSTNDRNSIAQYVSQGYFDQYTGQNILASVSKMRAAMLTADAWRSILIIALGAALMYYYKMKSEKELGINSAKNISALSIALLVICLVDMWMVNKRYLNDAMFQQPQRDAAIQKTPADDYILQKSGTGRDYRVLNFTVSTFNDNTTSALYSSVGGYHAAKLRRYQELIETHIAPEMSKVYEALKLAPIDTMAMATQQSPFPVYDLSQVNTDSLYPVLNMLNTRWFILGAGEGGSVKVPVENAGAMGNAWFVKDVKYVADANAEIAELSKQNLRTTAIVAEKDFGFLQSSGKADNTATVTMTEYTPNTARYSVNSKEGGVVVFSEVYYPGWQATIDGTPAEIGRANYVLRAMNVPSGQHEIVMTFDPQNIHTTETIAYAALALLLLLIATTLYIIYKYKE